MSDPCCEASGDEDVSRNASEPDSASLHQLKVVNLPNMVKPITGAEATGICRHWAFRGDWGRRASKDSSSNLGDLLQRSWKSNTGRESITCLVAVIEVG